MAISDGSDIGFGTAITFQTGLLAEIMDVKMSDFLRRKVALLVHMALTSGYIRKLPSDVFDPGKMTVSIAFKTDDLAKYKTAMTAAKETVTITFPIPTDGGVSAGTIAVTGFATGMSVAVPVEEFMTADIDIELSGVPTTVAAA